MFFGDRSAVFPRGQRAESDHLVGIWGFVATTVLANVYRTNVFVASCLLIVALSALLSDNVVCCVRMFVCRLLIWCSWCMLNRRPAESSQVHGELSFARSSSATPTTILYDERLVFNTAVDMTLRIRLAEMTFVARSP